jgi:hypothetical protein
LNITIEAITMASMIAVVSVQWGVLMARVTTLEKRLAKIERYWETKG